jgi:hypothetical protein
MENSLILMSALTRSCGKEVSPVLSRQIQAVIQLRDIRDVPPAAGMVFNRLFIRFRDLLLKIIRHPGFEVPAVIGKYKVCTQTGM